MNYVIAGYTVALGTLVVYGLSLLLRRRRWERALKASRSAEPADVGAPGGRP
jgi:nitrate reductase gamma subunit